MSISYKIKYVLSFVVAHLPLNCLRTLGYRLLGYRLGRKVQIGFGTRIHSGKVQIADNVYMGPFNRFFGLDTIIIGKNTAIGSRNEFKGGKFARGRHSKANYLEIGEEVHIISEHLLDAAFGLVVRDGVWIAGRLSSFWSHGSTKPNDTITIGKGCRFGGSCNIGTGVEIGENCLIAMGTVMTKSFPEEKCLIGGVPAKVLKKDFDWHEHWW